MDLNLQKLFQEDADDVPSNAPSPKSQMDSLFGRSPEPTANFQPSENPSRPAYGALKSMLKDIQERRQSIRNTDSSFISTEPKKANNQINKEDSIAFNSIQKHVHYSAPKSFDTPPNSEKIHAQTSYSSIIKRGEQIKMEDNSSNNQYSPNNQYSSKPNLQSGYKNQHTSFSWETQKSGMPQSNGFSFNQDSSQNFTVSTDNAQKMRQNVFPDEIPNRYQKSLFKTSIESKSNFVNTPKYQSQASSSNPDSYNHPVRQNNGENIILKPPFNSQISRPDSDPNTSFSNHIHSFQNQDTAPSPVNRHPTPPPPRMPPNMFNTPTNVKNYPIQNLSYSGSALAPNPIQQPPNQRTFGNNLSLGGKITSDPLVNPKAVNYFGSQVAQARTQLETNLKQNTRMSLSINSPPPPKLPPMLPSQQKGIISPNSIPISITPTLSESQPVKPLSRLESDAYGYHNRSNLYQISWYCNEAKSKQCDSATNTRISDSSDSSLSEKSNSKQSSLEIQSQLIEKLQWIQARDEFRESILSVLADGKIHSERELLQIAKKMKKQIGTVTFGLVMYSLIEHLGENHIIRSDQQESRFYQLSSDLKAACEFAFQDS